MISKISYNNDLYVVGEPIALSDTVDGIIYVPLDDVEVWKELNQGKNIEGYNYNVKRVTQDLFLPTEVTATSTDYNIINLFDGQICKEITITKTMHRGTSNCNNFITFPFDVTLKEIAIVLNNIPFNVYQSKDFMINCPVLENGKWGNGQLMRNSVTYPESTIIKAGKPIILSLDEDNPTHTLSPYNLKFYNKKIDLKNNLCAEKLPTEFPNDDRKGVDGWYFVGSVVKQKANSTGLSTAIQGIVIGTAGISNINMATGNLNAFSGQLEYRGVVPSEPIE